MAILGNSHDVDMNPHQGLRPGPRSGPGRTSYRIPTTVAGVAALTGFTPDNLWGFQDTAAPIVDAASGQNLSQIAANTYADATPFAGHKQMTPGVSPAGYVSGGIGGFGTGSWMFVYGTYVLDDLNQGALYGLATSGMYTRHNYISGHAFYAKEEGTLDHTLTILGKQPGYVVKAVGIDKSTNLMFQAVRGMGITNISTYSITGWGAVAGGGGIQTSDGAARNEPMLFLWLFKGDNGYAAAAERIVDSIF